MDENSCSDNSASSEFVFTASFESSVGLTVAVERCPFCSEAKRPFYCRSCVNNGTFISSTATYPDSYIELYRKWEIFKRERDQILERVKRDAISLQRRDEKKMAIEHCHQKIELLKLSLAAARQKALDDRKSSETTKKDNLMRFVKGKKHKEKKRRICDYIEKVTNAIDKKNERLLQKHEDLMAVRQKHVGDLTTYIFTVEEVGPREAGQSMAASDEVQKALKEASQTAYVRGRWVYSSSQYRIVAPVLPCLGDYSQYNICVARSREDSGSDAPNENSELYSISAGLCYTSQLVSVLAHILNVNPPKRQCYSEFAASDLTEKQFNSAVSRLNKNVLYLCFSQGVDMDHIEPKHTLHNIASLLRNQQLGRIGSYDIVQDMMDSVDDSNGQSEESDEDYNRLVDEPDSADWERVPQDIPETTVASDVSSIQSMGYMSQNLSESALTASGFVSSAVNSVASFFRR